MPTPAADEPGDPWTFAQVERAIESAALTMPAMSPGATTAATGAFAAAPTKTAKLDLRFAAFIAELEQFSAAPTEMTCTVSLSFYLEPGVEVPVNGPTPTLATLTVQTEATSVQLRSARGRLV